LAKDFNLENIIYSPVQHDSETKKSIYLYDKKPGKKIYIQSPQLCNIISLVNKKKYYELNLPLCGKKKSSVNSFIKFIKDLDNKIISDAKIHKNEWFDESNKNVRYRSLVKNIHDDYIDTIEYKSGMFENGIIKLKITPNTNITLNSNKILPDQLKIDNDLRTIFQIYAIWISGDLFGLYLKPIKIEQKYKIIEQIDFIASDSDHDTVYNTDVENLTEQIDSDTKSESSSISNNETESNSTSEIELESEQIIENQANIFSTEKNKEIIYNMLSTLSNKNLSESSNISGINLSNE
jgi:hypothetical protein